jgi:hypothetical protein
MVIARSSKGIPGADKNEKGAGLNGSTQHLLEAHAQGFERLRIARER